MRSWSLFPVLALTMLAVVSLADDPTPVPSPGEQSRVVIPFDFTSTFDQGRYGRMVGESIWKKLERRGRFIIPESMLDVRDWSSRTKKSPSPRTSLAEMQKIVRGDFDADIAIWGSVERVEGFDTDVYELEIRIVDFSGEKPQLVHEAKARTKTVSEIPHVYVKAALDKLYGTSPESAPTVDPAIEKRWASGPNLIAGDFEKGKDRPEGWDTLPRYVQLVTLSPESGAANRVIRFSFPKDVAATSGVLYYSDFFPVEEGATYRFQCRWRTTGSAAKVFIKCYDEIQGRFATQDGQPASTERREVYRSQQNLKGKARVWNVHTEDLTPKHTQYTPRWGRVMLYAYWPAGTVDWDDLVLKQISPPKNSPGEKIRRPSLETKVRSEELDR